jgi:hypothetical protein
MSWHQCEYFFCWLFFDGQHSISILFLNHYVVDEEF